MTDLDPAVEAARGMWPWMSDENPCVEAARKALAPYRARHRPFHRGNDGAVCNYCYGPRPWPCPDALDAYPEGEL